MNRQPVVIGFLIVVLALVVAPYPFAARAAESARSTADFDGDKVDDLAIGVPYKKIRHYASAGMVHVLYGEPVGGLSATGNQVWHQDVAGVPDHGDEFGFALAAGDWNGDGYLDLATGVHGEVVGAIPAAGAVQVFYGTATGLTVAGWQLRHQDSPGIGDDAEADDRFGWSLGAGDFNGDGYEDLAIGVLWEDLESPSVQNAGAVHVIYGSASGLTATNSQVWYEGRNGVRGVAGAQDMFGHTLSSGDFNADGHDDLVIGVPWNDLSGSLDSGSVHVLYGSATGLTATGNQLLYQDAMDVADSSEAGDRFGHALTTGDSNGDGYDDLVVGVPFEDFGTPVINDAGAVHIFYGAATGLTTTGNRLLHQDTLGVTDSAEAGDRFGQALTSGDFDGDGDEDLAVGVPGEGVGSPVKGGAGAVHLFYTMSGATNHVWHQDSTGVGDLAEANDAFGYSLAAGDFDGDGCADLAIGVPWEDILSPVIVDAGAVVVLYGSAAGITGDGNAFWHQAIAGVIGDPEANDRFGLSLAAIPTVRYAIYLPVVQRQSPN